MNCIVQKIELFMYPSDGFNKYEKIKNFWSDLKWLLQCHDWHLAQTLFSCFSRESINNAFYFILYVRFSVKRRTSIKSFSDTWNVNYYITSSMVLWLSFLANAQECLLLPKWREYLIKCLSASLLNAFIKISSALHRLHHNEWEILNRRI